MSVFQAEMPRIDDLAILVEMDREDRTRFHLGIEESELLFHAGNVVPGVGSEDCARRRIAKLRLDGRFRVGSCLDGGFTRRVGKITPLAYDRHAARKQQEQ